MKRCRTASSLLERKGLGVVVRMEGTCGPGDVGMPRHMMEAANIARMSAICSEQTKMMASLVYYVSRKSS